MVHVTNSNTVLFCLLFFRFYSKTESRFVYRDTGKDAGTALPTELSKSNNQEENHSNGVKNDSKQGYGHDGIQPNSAAQTPGSQFHKTGSGDREKESSEYYSGKEETIAGTHAIDTLLVSPKENPQEEEERRSGAGLNPNIRSGIFRPNGLESDIDDPSDVITHIKPCEPQDSSCSSDKDNSNTSDNPKRSINGQAERYQDNQASNSPPRSNQAKMYEVKSENKEHKRFTGAKTEAGYEDAYF